MLYFQSDYLEGCAPEILKLLNETNLTQTPGYEADAWCEKARSLILEATGNPEPITGLSLPHSRTLRAKK